MATKCCENKDAGEGTRTSVASRSFQTVRHCHNFSSFPIDPVSANCYDRKQQPSPSVYRVVSLSFTYRPCLCLSGRGNGPRCVTFNFIERIETLPCLCARSNARRFRKTLSVKLARASLRGCGVLVPNVFQSHAIKRTI